MFGGRGGNPRLYLLPSHQSRSEAPIQAWTTVLRRREGRRFLGQSRWQGLWRLRLRLRRQIVVEGDHIGLVCHRPVKWVNQRKQLRR